MVINVLKDGTVVDDMSKIMVPVTDETKRAYEILAGNYKF